MEGYTWRFRFGIPLVLKYNEHTYSTEAHALRFLNNTVPHLPIPRLIDYFELDGRTYTLMTKIHGQTLLEMEELTPEELKPIVDDMVAFLHELWQVPQPETLRGQVFLSASGHGLPHPALLHEKHGIPYPSIHELYKSLTWEDLSAYPSNAIDAVVNDNSLGSHRFEDAEYLDP